MGKLHQRRTAMISASVNEMAVSGMVTVRPGSNILPKESTRIPQAFGHGAELSFFGWGAGIFPTKTVSMRCHFAILQE
ncbi:MAG: hypothetical protein ACLURG_06130 [Gemmiger sp.]